MFYLLDGYYPQFSSKNLLPLLSIIFALFTRFPYYSGFSNFKNIQYKNCQITPGTQLDISQICCLLSVRLSFLSTLRFKVFQFCIFLAVELAGGQLCNQTNLGLQQQSNSATITPSEKSLLIFFLGRENGTLSTILQTSYIQVWFIRNIQLLYHEKQERCQIKRSESKRDSRKFQERIKTETISSYKAKIVNKSSCQYQIITKKQRIKQKTISICE